MPNNQYPVALHQNLLINLIDWTKSSYEPSSKQSTSINPIHSNLKFLNQNNQSLKSKLMKKLISMLFKKIIIRIKIVVKINNKK